MASSKSLALFLFAVAVSGFDMSLVTRQQQHVNTTFHNPLLHIRAEIPTPDAATILNVVFKLLGVSGVDTQTCVKDISGSGHEFKDFAQDFEGKNYTTAVISLGRAISSLSSSVKDCGVPQVQARLDALAAAIRWANISTAGFDKAVEILVGASDLEKDIEALSAAVRSGSASDIGDAIGAMVNDFSNVFGGCGSSKACKLVDGILQIVQAVAKDVGPCESAIEPAIQNLTYAVDLWQEKKAEQSVESMAKGLDYLAQALANDACGLKPLANVLAKVAPKLEAAIVKEVSGKYQIVVKYADVYDEFYQAITAIASGDFNQAGLMLGRLLQSLRASNCKTKACIVIEGLLGVFQLELQDFSKCSGKADNAWYDIENAMSRFESGSLGQAVGYLAQGVQELAGAVSACDIPELAQILEDTAKKLGGSAVSAEIASVVSIIVEGADVTDDLARASQDFKAQNWAAFGNDLGTLSDLVASSKCNLFVCKVVEGLLHAFGIALQDLSTCKQDLYAANQAFIAGAQYFGQKKIGSAVNEWAEGLNEISKAVTGCGITDELKYIEQEANVFGFANTTILDDVTKVLVHGTDFYEELYATLQAFEHHDYRAVGQSLGEVMNDLAQWTEGHACTSDICYMVVGVLQFLGDIEGSFKACETDLKSAWTDFGDAYQQFHDSHQSVIFHWQHDKDAIKAGLADLGKGFTAVSNSVGDCHMQEFADLLEKLAVKLGVAPEISWIEQILHILINGVEIEKEVGAACTDYSEGNWVGFGFELAKLIKTLV